MRITPSVIGLFRLSSKLALRVIPLKGIATSSAWIIPKDKNI
jgi:hypothetical protein